MKKDNKGFMMVETLLVATVIMTALIFLYVQFQNINKNYNISFSYNTVNSLYATNNIKKFIIPNYGNLIKKLDASSKPYLDLTNCSNNYVSEVNFCSSLLDNLKVTKVIFSKEDITDLKNYISNNQDFNQKLMDFINYVNDTKDNNYRLIVEFEDATYATLKISNKEV